MLFLCPGVSSLVVDAGSSTGGRSGLGVGPTLGIPHGVNPWDALQTHNFSKLWGIKSSSSPVFGLCVKSVSHGNVSLVKAHLFSLPSGLLVNGGAKLCFHCQLSLIFRNECGQRYCFTYSLNGKRIEFP